MMESSTQIAPEAEAPEVSTELQPEGTPAEASQHKALSRDEAIEQAIKDSETEAPEDDKPDEAAEKEPEEEGEKKPAEKAEKAPAKRAEDGKFAADKPKEEEPSGEQDDGEERPVNKQAQQGFASAPQHFLPDAKERWANTPHAVRREVETLVKSKEEAEQLHQEIAQRYEPIRQFDEYVRQNGRAGVHETLAEVAQLEDLIAQNPLAALNQILLRAGPKKPDGSPVSLFEVAQAVVQMGHEGYNQAVQRLPQQQAPAQNDNPRIQQLEQQLETMRREQVRNSIIEPFRAAHPRYDELEKPIAFFLKSGMIPDSLSTPERLEVAYDMAVRINPASHVSPPETEADPATENRVEPDSGGPRTLRGAPPTGADRSQKRRVMSKDEAIEKALNAIGA